MQFSYYLLFFVVIMTIFGTNQMLAEGTLKKGGKGQQYGGGSKKGGKMHTIQQLEMKRPKIYRHNYSQLIFTICRLMKKKMKIITQLIQKKLKNMNMYICAHDIVYLN